MLGPSKSFEIDDHLTFIDGYIISLIISLKKDALTFEGAITNDCYLNALKISFVS